MKQYQKFIFESYAFDPDMGRIELRYSLDEELKFTETLEIPKGGKWAVNSETLHAALFALHLIGGISYYKTCLPKTIEVRSGSLTKEQADFWNDVYENGLGEFFYKNNIDFRNLIQFPFQTKNQKLKTNNQSEQSPLQKGIEKKYLVPIGGGKDSMVTVELLRKAGADITLLRMGGHPLIDELAATAQLPLLTVGRKLDPLLFRLNTEGALNGHIPISAYLSCLSVVMAILEGFDAVVLSNEGSANEGNVEIFGKEINHQWSKSFAFEIAFRMYVQMYIDPALEYFSLLRPLSELHIARIFAQYPQYFEKTTSCNANWKILGEKSRERWCGHCPKCAFVFALMAAFLPKETLEQIFGKNLYADVSLLPLYLELLGKEGMKPFECVGTPEETEAAMILAHRRGDLDDTPVMQMFLKDVFPKIAQPDRVIEYALTPARDHCIPKELQKIFL